MLGSTPAECPASNLGGASGHPVGHPASDIDLAKLFAGLRDAPALLLAVSGGPDSMALLHLAHRWRALSTSGPPLRVATVDHGLRPQAAAEAELVAEQAGFLGLPHATLAWIGEKPSGGLQARAREARYRLLCEHARLIGAPFILTAHHADDQAETVLMRLGRGSGIAGLAAMDRITSLRDGIALVRPFLDIPKRSLMAICTDRALAFVIDPSNENPAYHRARLRGQADAAADLGLDTPTLLRLSRRMARADNALEAETDRIMALLCPVGLPGRWCADLGPIGAATPEIVQRVVGRAVLAVAGPGHLPLERLEALADALRAALGTRRPYRGTLAGTLLALDAAGTLTVTPEPPRRRGRSRPD